MALIDNDYEMGVKPRRRPRNKRNVVEIFVGRTGSMGRGLHLTPTKRMKIDEDTGISRHWQNKCRLCGSKTMYVCAECSVLPSVGEIESAYCAPVTGRTCYRTHMEQLH
jgi:hypothetical protein